MHHAAVHRRDTLSSALLSQQLVDIFPVTVPRREQGYLAVSLYCDDKGVAKGAERNRRAEGLISAVGHSGPSGAR